MIITITLNDDELMIERIERPIDATTYATIHMILSHIDHFTPDGIEEINEKIQKMITDMINPPE